METLYCKNATGQTIACPPADPVVESSILNPTFDFGTPIDNATTGGVGIPSDELPFSEVGKTLLEGGKNAVNGVIESFRGYFHGALALPPGLAIGSGLINAFHESNQAKKYEGGFTIDDFLTRFGKDGVFSPIIISTIVGIGAAIGLLPGDVNAIGLLLSGGAIGVAQLLKGKDSVWRNRLLIILQFLLVLSLPFFALTPATAAIAGGIIAVRNMISHLSISGINVNPLKKEGINTIKSTITNVKNDLMSLRLWSNTSKTLMVGAGVTAAMASIPVVSLGVAGAVGAGAVVHGLLKNTQKVDKHRLENDPDIERFFTLFQKILAQDEADGQKAFTTLSEKVPFLSTKRIKNMTWDEKRSHFDLGKKGRMQFMKELLNQENETGVTTGWNAFLYKREKKRKTHWIFQNETALHMTPNEILDRLALIGRTANFKVDPYTSASDRKKSLWAKNKPWVEKIMESNDLMLRREIVKYISTDEKKKLYKKDAWERFLNDNATSIRNDYGNTTNSADSMLSVFNALQSKNPEAANSYISQFENEFNDAIFNGTYTNEIAEKINLQTTYNSLEESAKSRFLQAINSDTAKGGLKSIIVKILTTNNALSLTFSRKFDGYNQWTHNFETAEAAQSPSSTSNSESSGGSGLLGKITEHGISEILWEMIKKGWSKS